MAKGRWTLISKAASLARSSHCVSITNTGLLVVYGGELKPRAPVDTGSEQDTVPRGTLHAFGLNNSDLSQKWIALSPPVSPSDGESQKSSEIIPDPRVGATTVWLRDALYMWGGRGGTDMAPLDAPQVGVWKATIAVAQDPHGAPGSVTWEKVTALNEQEAPAARSYHTSVAHGDKFYVHAGCPTSGRLGSLHAFDVRAGVWEVLAEAPEPGRGGASLVAAALPGAKNILLRYGGFSGYELPSVPGSVDIYSIEENKWHTVQPGPDAIHGVPGARSVHGFARFQSSSPSLCEAVAVLYHGERDASALGHAGAGSFWDDVWLLVKSAGGDRIDAGWRWEKVDVGQTNAPEGRGWFPSASWVEPNGCMRVALFGGLLSSNARSDELWGLEID
ncbi:galactose oxidase [Trametes meyenii]|nr:galactose oxidase [Trametes meyenii]